MICLHGRQGHQQRFVLLVSSGHHSITQNGMDQC
jgi:hypothetical protein